MWTLGTDCSGMDAVVAALRILGVQDYRYTFASDIDPNCRVALRHQEPPPEQIFGDITERALALVPQVDLYIAGFPCQSFSLLTTNRKDREHGLADDAKKSVLDSVLAYVRSKLPRMFVLENVKNLIAQGGLQYILGALAGCGYSIDYRVLSPHDYGHPQSRNRIFIIGTRSGTVCWPDPVVAPRTPLADLLVPRTDALEKQPKLGRALTAQAQGFCDSLEWDPQRGRNCIVDLNLASYRHRGNDTRPRLEVCPCLNTRCYYFYILNQSRYLSLTDCLRIQGYPDDYLDGCGVSLTNKFKMVGNSICVPLLAQILACNQPHFRVA